MTSRERTWWGWGYEDRQIDPAPLAAGIAAQLGFGRTEPEDPADLAAVPVGAPRVESPWPASPRERLRHSLGSSYLDAIRGFRGQVVEVVDAVARPRDEAGVEAVLAWARDANAAVIPYGGGTSVVGGVARASRRASTASSRSTSAALDRVLEVDAVSRAARIQAGARGPALEEQLGAHGLTMRFFPQSFELSTLGGWIATRAGGHFATLWTHIDDLVESVRASRPSGAWESRRLPGSGAGPVAGPDAARQRGHARRDHRGVGARAAAPGAPRRRARCASRTSWRGAEAVRALAQSGLHPATAG